MLERSSKFLYKSILLFTLVQLILRFTLYILTIPANDKTSLGDYLYSFYLGCKFDLRLVAILMLPLIALFIINYLVSKFTRLKPFELILKISHFYQATIVTSLVFVFFMDFYYYSYQKVRISSSIFRFLVDTKTSGGMLYQTYPILRIALLLLATFLATFYLLNKLIKNTEANKLSLKKTIISRTTFFMVWILMAYGKFSYYPLRWSEAFFSTNTHLNNLTLNAPLYFLNSLKFKDVTYDKKKVKEYYPVVSEFLGVNNPQLESLDFKRFSTPDNDKQAQAPNVVIVLLESLASFKTSYFGSPLKSTPYLDSIINESLVYSNFFTPTVATARSVFTTFTSLPDVSKVKTGSRNPLIVNQNVLANYLEGYEKFYFLGGSANWGNIRGIIQSNIQGINLFEEGSYDAPRVDVWGISDLDLFKFANKQFKNLENKKPFFAVVQSSGFHRPYSIPEGQTEFKVENPTKEQVAEAGFVSAAEYNSLRLQDFSFGKFMELAKKEKYYENTIFIIYGDHGLPHDNAKNVPDWQRSLGLTSYRVPLVIHAPKFFKHEIRDKVVSEVDILPTVAYLTGTPVINKSLGRNIFDDSYDEKRQSFFFKFFFPHDYGVIDKEYLYKYIPNMKKGILYKHSSDFMEGHEVTNDFPDLVKKYHNLATGLYETAKYMHYNNKREKLEK